MGIDTLDLKAWQRSDLTKILQDFIGCHGKTGKTAIHFEVNNRLLSAFLSGGRHFARLIHIVDGQGHPPADRLFQLLRERRPHHQNRLLKTGLSQLDAFGRGDHGHAPDIFILQSHSNRHHAVAVGLALHHGTNLSRSSQLG